MGKAYREMTGFEGVKTTEDDMREMCKRGGKIDEEGNIIYFTEQHHKKECDVNYIIEKYDRTGLLSSINKIESKFGNLSGDDFKAMQDKVSSAVTMFEELPSDIRKKFENSPKKLLDFMDDENNRNEAIELGLIDKDWTEATDGLGEHIKNDSERKKKTDEEENNNNK